MHENFPIRKSEGVAGGEPADIEKCSALRVGTPGLQEKVTNKMWIELRGDIRGKSHDVKRVAENKLAGGMGIKKGPASKQIARTPQPPRFPIVKNKRKIANQSFDTLLRPLPPRSRNQFFVQRIRRHPFPTVS